MPESKTRKAADEKKRSKRVADVEKERTARRRRQIMPGQRAWVPPLFMTALLLGVAWLVVYYIAGYQIPYMRDWGNWNIAIGMGLMALGFILATLWK